MKNYKSTIGSLVEDEIYTWYFQAKDEKEAFRKAFKYWEKKNYADHGTLEVEEINDQKERKNKK